MPEGTAWREAILGNLAEVAACEGRPDPLVPLVPSVLLIEVRRPAIAVKRIEPAAAGLRRADVLDGRRRYDDRTFRRRIVRGNDLGPGPLHRDHVLIRRSEARLGQVVWRPIAIEGQPAIGLGSQGHAKQPSATTANTSDLFIAPPPLSHGETTHTPTRE